jgi:endoglycosylceramidase
MRLPLLLVLVVASTASASGALRTDGTFFRDEAGAVVILRGVNVAGNAKVPPFTPITDLSLLDPLPKWGFNAIRLLFTWEAYEPMPGQYSASYLAYIRGVIQAAHARGLYVVVDFHQDGYSRYALGGCGEGFPAWTLPADVTPAMPDNGPACHNWGARLVGDAELASIWHRFYAGEGGVREAYLAMIGRVATALSGEPGVIGYDLINEPEGDEASELGPFYEDAAAAVRAGDRNVIVFIEPNITTGGGGATRLPKPTFGNFAFAPHFYDATLTVGAWSGSDESAQLATLTSAAATWKVPLFLGEFGAAVTVDQVDGYLGAIAQQLDDKLMSSAQWAYTPGWTAAAKDGWNGEDFSIVDGSGALRANFRPRPFARRIAGTPVAFTLVEGKTPGATYMVLGWHHDPAAGATELFAPAAYFGGAITVDGGDLVCRTAGDVVSCTSDSAGDVQVRVGGGRSCGLTGAEALLLVWLLRRRRAVSAACRA